MRHSMLYILRHIFHYTSPPSPVSLHPGPALSMRWIRSTSSNRSRGRKRAFPAEIIRNGSGAARLVHAIGSEATWPFRSRKYTRFSRQPWRHSIASNSWSNHGWKGWVTRKEPRVPAVSRAVGKVFEDFLNQPSPRAPGFAGAMRIVLLGRFRCRQAGASCICAGCGNPRAI
jgi:hypothetical protein